MIEWITSIQGAAVLCCAQICGAYVLTVVLEHVRWRAER